MKAKTVIKACFLGFPGNRIFPGFGCFGQSYKIGHRLGDSLVIKLKQNFASGSFQFGIKSILQFFSTKDGMLKRRRIISRKNPLALMIIDFVGLSFCSKELLKRKVKR